MLRIVDLMIGNFVMTLGIIAYSKVIMKGMISKNKLKILIYLMIGVVSNAIISLNTIGLTRFVLMEIVYLYIIEEIFNTTTKKSLLVTMIYAIIILLVEIIELIVFTKIIGMTKPFYYEIYAGGIMANILINLMSIFLAKILQKPIITMVSYTTDSINKIITSFITPLMFIYIIFYSFLKIYRESGNIVFHSFAIVTSVILLIEVMNQTIKNSKLIDKYDKLLEFMKTYEEEIEKQRILRHETKNQLLTIKAKVCDKEQDEKVIEYIDSILEESIELSQEHYAKFQYLPANGLKALFYFKTNQAEKAGIKVSINIGETIKDSILYNLNTYNFKQLGRLLGIYLDNAIEASKHSPNKAMGIEIYKVEENIEILISNSFKEEEKISKNGLSSKGKNRGHGLLLAKEILNNNSIYKAESKIINNIYIQKVIIKNLSNK